MDVDAPGNDRDQVRLAVWFIATQPDGPRRLLDRHQNSSSGLCPACSSVSHVRWPCPLASMALLAEAAQRQRAPGSAPDERGEGTR